jgi:hypothetical protein
MDAIVVLLFWIHYLEVSLSMTSANIWFHGWEFRVWWRSSMGRRVCEYGRCFTSWWNSISRSGDQSLNSWKICSLWCWPWSSEQWKAHRSRRGQKKLKRWSNNHLSTGEYSIQKSTATQLMQWETTVRKRESIGWYVHRWTRSFLEVLKHGRWSSKLIFQAFSWNNKAGINFTWALCEWIRPCFLADNFHGYNRADDQCFRKLSTTVKAWQTKSCSVKMRSWGGPCLA